MRTIAAMSTVILMLIAVVGLGAGTFEVLAALHLFSQEHVSMLDALLAGAVPFAIGTIALGAVAVVAAIDVAAKGKTRAQVDP
jgi:biotin transporter BioY